MNLSFDRPRQSGLMALMALLIWLPFAPVDAMKLVDRLLPYNENGVAGPDDFFARVMAIDGDTMVVGAPGTDISIAGYYNKGVAYVYQHDGQDWQLVTHLEHPDGAWNFTPQFAEAVEVSGDHIFVSMDNGQIAVFTNTQNQWLYTTTISYQNNPSVLGNRFMSYGDMLLVASVSGVQVFKHQDNLNTWQYLSTITYPDPQIDGWFGFDMAIEDDLAVIGTYSSSNNPYSYIYRRTGDNWNLEYRPPAQLNVASRNSVDISNGVVIINAETGPKLYDDQAGSWQQTGTLPLVNGCVTCLVMDVLIENDQAAYMMLDYAEFEIQAEMFNKQNNSWIHFDTVIPSAVGYAPGTSVLTDAGLFIGLTELYDGSQNPVNGSLDFHAKGVNDYQLDVTIKPPKGTPQTEIGNHLLADGNTAFTNGTDGLFEFTQVAGQWLYTGMVDVVTWLNQSDGGLLMEISFPDVLSTFTKVNNTWVETASPISGVSEYYHLSLPYLLVNPAATSQFDLYQWVNGDWTFQRSMGLTGITGSGHQFVISIANDRALIGVPDFNQAFLLDLITGNEVDMVTATNGASFFGRYVALNDSQAIIAGCSSTSIHSYDFAGNGLNFLSVLDQPHNYIGCIQQLVMNDQYLAFRTQFQTNGSAPNHHNYEVHQHDGIGWELQSRLHLIRNYWTDSQSNITLNGDQLSISMPHDDDRGYDSGTVFVYDVSYSDLIVAHDYEN